MSRFDDFVDEFIFMAKNAADVASKKTNEVVEVNKIRYQMKQVEWEIEKAYAKLGAIVYESKKSADNFDEIIGLAISEIDDLKERYESFSERIRAYKNVTKCTECGRENEQSFAFCSRCGAALNNDPPVSEDPQQDDNDSMSF